MKIEHGIPIPPGGSGMNARTRLPRAYFADAQDHIISAAPENPRRSEQSGAESGDASGESGAAVHSIDRAQQLHAARTIFGS